MRKLLALILTLCLKCQAIEYIDGQVVTLYKVLTGSHVVKLGVDYFAYGSEKDNEIDNRKKSYGIHNMQVIVKGHEPINLIKDDICFYPRLFTLIAYMMPEQNPVVQRWSRVKYIHPLSFAFKIDSGRLKISSALYRWKPLAPCLTEEVVSLRQIENVSMAENLSINVVVNGKSIELIDEIVVLQ